MMDEFMLHEEYHKSTLGEDGEVPLDALGSPPQTEMDSFLYLGPSTDMADTLSLPKRPRVPESMASRPANNFKGSRKESGSSSPRAHLWGSGSQGRTYGQTSIRI